MAPESAVVAFELSATTCQVASDCSEDAMVSGHEAVRHVRLIDLSKAAAGDGVDRSVQFAAFLERMAGADGGGADAPRTGRAADVVASLSRAGRLSFDGEGPWTAHYNPSHEALASVMGARSTLPERIAKRQQQAARPTPGAIFRCPAESGEEHLDLFITDWSPCPAACALAIHRHHPFARDTRRADPSHFTGRYARHPLTGDLLPVWVASWVKPEFGTGVVLVNPAHDHMDMEFGRQVGLPIRFALVPDGFDGTPATWPAPPVIKTGRTIKTGPYDGLSPAEAVATYLRRLEEVGLGWRHTDYQLEQRTVATLVPDEGGELGLCPNCGLVEPAGPEASCRLCGRERRRVGLEDAWLLDEVAGVLGAGGPITVVCPARAVEGELALLPPLLCDLGEEPAFEAIHVVQRCELAKANGEPARLAAAALVSGKPGDVGVVRQQLVDQVDRFLGQHGQLLETADLSEPAAGEVPPAVRTIVRAIRQADLGRAFSQLYSLQKQLVGGTGRSTALEAGYFACGEVLFGLPVPPGGRVSSLWRSATE
jgi:leucyl-tRNA synthetase